MAEDNEKRTEELAKDLDNLGDTELDGRDLEGASGGGSTDHIE